MAKDVEELELDEDLISTDEEMQEEEDNDAKEAKHIENKRVKPKLPDIDPEKLKTLNTAIAKIVKDQGKGSIMNMGARAVEKVDVIPTGSISLDIALGVGGYPRGRVVEIYGQESSGKTTLAIHAIAEAQKLGGLAAIVDAEHAFDSFYAESLGVDLDRLWISQPDNGEQALNIVEDLVRSQTMDLIIVDSVAALTPKGEIEGNMGDNRIGLQARLMSQALRKLTSVISKCNTVVIFINQLREKIASGPFSGPTEVTTGGNALKYYSSIRIEIKKGAPIRDGDEVFGTETRVKVAKNKLAPPFKKAKFDLMYGEGISHAGEIVDIATDLEIIKKSGSWYSYGNDRLGQGRDKVKAFLTENIDLADLIEKKIKEAALLTK